MQNLGIEEIPDAKPLLKSFSFYCFAREILLSTWFFLCSVSMFISVFLVGRNLSGRVYPILISLKEKERERTSESASHLTNSLQLVIALNILYACAIVKQVWLQNNMQTYRGQSPLARRDPTNLLKHISTKTNRHNTVIMYTLSFRSTQKLKILILHIKTYKERYEKRKSGGSV